MTKTLFVFVFYLISVGVFAQESSSMFTRKKIKTTRDTLVLSDKSINPSFFKLTDTKGQDIDTTLYTVDFVTSTLIFKSKTTDSVYVRYLQYPDFMTKTYKLYDTSQIVDKPNILQSIRSSSRENATINSPFEGLNTSGSLTRGITVGNNQNAVVNSVLDLQISGKLAEDINVRASIQDNNIPIQSDGYSQKLDQFDQVFIELYGKSWNVRAGDLFLENRKSSILNFNKKVQGIATDFTFGTEDKTTRFYNSVGLVRGQYSRSTFTGKEGNQGPYKLTGSNGELYVLVISGSERVYVNGVLLERGENKQYTIDYNAGEVVFNPTFPINSEMRINVEYQFSDRNYNRFVTYNAITHQQSKWNFGAYLYAESDIKNQPLQQSLSDDQKIILSQAGDDKQKMVASSSFSETYDANKIQYIKQIINSQDVFVYATQEAPEVYSVRFSYKGKNKGNYILTDVNLVDKIYQYVAPINGISQGDYEPLINLIAPTNSKVASFETSYKNKDKTDIRAEIGISQKDGNLFSAVDDTNNTGIATKISFNQLVLNKKWKTNVFGGFQLIQETFNPIERLFTIEFNRDWNLNAPKGNQSLLTSGVEVKLPENGNIRYEFNRLQFGDDFSGNKHYVSSSITRNKWHLDVAGNAMQSSGTFADSRFLRSQNRAKYQFYKNWVGGSFRYENNQEKRNDTQQFSANTQRFQEYGTFVGRGDSTKVYVELGYLQRANDSLSLGVLQRVNVSNSYYIKSKLIETDNNSLSVFLNYRRLNYTDPNKKAIPSLNSRLLYNTYLFNKKTQINTLYETVSGTIAQQDFTYLEVDSGKGVYVWNDYNANGIKELSEFEIAKFIDQAKYIRVFLPNQIYLKTHQNKFSSTVTLNPTNWQNDTGFKKVASHFYNQTSYLIERKIKQQQNGFDLNPFATNTQDALGINASVRNSLFYNRGKQKNSTTYTFLKSSIKNQLATGAQDNSTLSHQITYTHLLQSTWLFNFLTKTYQDKSTSQNFVTRNYLIDGFQLSPKIGYVFSTSATVDLFYEFQLKNNQIGFKESLSQHRLGTSFIYSGIKNASLNGEFSFYKNQYTGDANSSVAYQILEGLLPGNNITWRLLMQRNITQFLDINLNYQGRKSDASKAIHTGNIQLRAYF